MANSLWNRTVAALGLLFLSPLLVGIACAVAFTDGFPVLFRHRRVGRDGKEFLLLKFRSMRRNTGGPSITAGADPRVTPVGRLLRKYKLDELPQLWNVMKGEMRLVGPRPEVPELVTPDDPAWRALLRVPPGITDLATLVYRNEEEILAASPEPQRFYREVVLPQKLALNLQYLKARSFRTDLRLIVMTVRYSFLPSGFQADRVRQTFAPGVNA